MRLLPRFAFPFSGRGKGETRIEAFENALLDAGVDHLNLVKVSSIIPRDCEIISYDEGIVMFEDGEIAFCILGESYGGSVGVGWARYVNVDVHGYFVEHSVPYRCYDIGEKARELAEKMLKNKFGINGEIESGSVSSVCESEDECAVAGFILIM